MAKSRKKKSGYKWIPRDSNLIVLTDQDSGQKISPKIFELNSRDQSWNTHLETFLRANRESLSSLDITVDLKSGREEIDAILKPNGIIGAIPLRAPNTFKICASNFKMKLLAVFLEKISMQNCYIF